MLQIRRGIFETNSSSSHSIIIKKKDLPIAKVTDPEWRMYIDEDDENNPRNGVIKFDDRDLEFDRDPFHFLVDWYDRLAYAIAACQSRDTVETLADICRRRIPGFRGFRFPSKHWILDDENEEEDAEPADYYGYVDHQSECLLEKVLNHYKDFGRGHDYYNQNSNVERRIRWVANHIEDLSGHFRSICFDDLAVRQLDLKNKINPAVWQQLYMGCDGEFTMYVDLVRGEYAASSTAERRTIVCDDIRKMFACVHWSLERAW